MHIDGKEFLILLSPDNTIELNIEQLAEEAHYVYHKHHPEAGAAVPWAELDEVFKESNRNQVMDIPVKLSAIGCGYDDGSSSNPSVKDFTDIEIEIMARMEHDRWLQEKIDQGWEYAPKRVSELRKHNLIVPWEQLTIQYQKDDEQAKDIEVANNIIPLLEKIGMRVYRK